NPVEIGRVNYVLRAIHIDGGKHHVVLTFKPRSEQITEAIAYSALTLLALLFVGLLVRQIRWYNFKSNRRFISSEK
ncbi:MAG: hypothetical protein J6Y39_02335, partial [Bacteroidaceae bacterium]|nr:hypothetical protein [Bacteroidaceae bacterium]